MKVSGVYHIKCIKNGKRYVGSSVNVHYRLSVHRNLLNRNKHFCKPLQNAWNKYGGNSFRFVLTRVCSVDDRIKFEQQEIDTVKILFNTTKIAGISPGTGKPVTFISPDGNIINGKHVKEIAEKYKLPHSILCCIASGKRKHFRGWCLPDAKVTYEPRKVISPDGTVYTFDCVSSFAKEQNMNVSGFYQILSKRAKQHKGWKSF